MVGLEPAIRADRVIRTGVRLPRRAREAILVDPMSKPEDVEPLYAGLKDAKSSRLPLSARVAIVVLFLGFLFWIVWLQAH